MAATPSSHRHPKRPPGLFLTLPPTFACTQDIFYEKADALVGVARDVDQGCSRTYTFDLNRFEPPLDADTAR